jgi:hypothetical protein
MLESGNALADTVEFAERRKVIWLIDWGVQSIEQSIFARDPGFYPARRPSLRQRLRGKWANLVWNAREWASRNLWRLSAAIDNLAHRVWP